MDHLENIDRFAVRGLWMCLVWTGLASNAPALGPPAMPPELAGVPRLWLEEFDLTGNTLEEIRKSLDENILLVRKEEGTIEASALTSYQFEPTWSRVEDGSGGCRIENVRVQQHFRVKLPRLVTINPSPAVAERWALFRRALEKHEARHVRITLEYSDRMQRELPGTSCDRADGFAETLRELEDAEQDAYDDSQCVAYASGDFSKAALDECAYPYLDEPIDEAEKQEAEERAKAPRTD